MHRQLKLMGLKFFLRKNTWSIKNNACMEDILSMNDPHIIYALGFLWGDGHLFQKKGKYYGIRMGIVRKDFEDIEKSFLQLGMARVYYPRRIKNWKKQTHWILSDIRLANFLFDNDYHVKSYSCPTKILSIIPEKLRSYWWRGFFDADGHLHVKNGIPKRLFFGGQINYSWELPLKEMARIGILFTASKKHSKTGNCSLFSCCRQYDMMKFLRFIYDGIESDKIGLKRKAIKFIKLKNFVPHIKTSSHKNIMYGKLSNGSRKWIFRIRKHGNIVIRKIFNTEQEAIDFKTHYFRSLRRMSSVSE